MATPGMDQSSTPNEQSQGTPQGGKASDRHAATERGLSGEIKQLVRDKTFEQFDTQKQRATNQLGHLATAVRGMTQSLRDNGQSGVADYVNRAADGLERWSSVLQRQDPQQAMRELQNAARRNPALFLGAAFGVGVLAARFFKSSAQADDDQWRRETPYGSGMTGSASGMSTSGSSLGGSSSGLGNSPGPSAGMVR